MSEWLKPILRYETQSMFHEWFLLIRLSGVLLYSLPQLFLKDELNAVRVDIFSDISLATNSNDIIELNN